MKIIQYSNTIPADKQADYLDFCKNVLGPTWKEYRCIKYEVSKVEENKVVGRQITEPDRFIERLYFEDNVDLKKFYADTLKNEFEKTRSYEQKFGANSIELRILDQKVTLQ